MVIEYGGAPVTHAVGQRQFGRHLHRFAVEGPIGLKLATGGREGRRLGQFGGARNLGTISGVGLIFVLAKLIGDRYDLFFAIAAACAAAVNELGYKAEIAGD